MSSDEQKTPLILTPQMRERISSLVNPEETTLALIRQVEAELGPNYFQEKDKTK